MERKFYSSNGKKEYTTTKTTCNCPGSFYRWTCGHIKFMNHPHKKSELADYEFVKFFFLLK